MICFFSEDRTKLRRDFSASGAMNLIELADEGCETVRPRLMAAKPSRGLRECQLSAPRKSGALQQRSHQHMHPTLQRNHLRKKRGRLSLLLICYERTDLSRQKHREALVHQADEAWKMPLPTPLHPLLT